MKEFGHNDQTLFLIPLQTLLILDSRITHK